MKSMTGKRFLSLVLTVCMLVGIIAVLPISIPVSAANISTSGNYFFKVGADSALSAGTRVADIDEPFEYGGTVYIPVSSLSKTIGSPAGGTSTINGISAVSLANIPNAYSGYSASISNMKLIAISKTANFFNNHTDDEQVSLMKKFIFDTVGTDGSTQLSPFSVDSMQSLSHPYLYANQTRFDELRQIYLKGEAGTLVSEDDLTLYSYIKEKITHAERQYSTNAQSDVNGNYVAMNTTVNLARGHQDYIFEIPYQTTASGNGYDAGGRLQECVSHAERILLFAFAYQITRDMNYAKLAYQYAIYLGQWEHWGPGHMLNSADTSAPYALAYDWLYNAWKQLESDGSTYKYFNGTYTDNKPQFDTKNVSVAAIEEIIFTHSLFPAYMSMTIPTSSSSSGGSTNNNKTSLNIPWISTTAGIGGYDYHSDTNNWNAVCAAGFTVASLAVVGVTTNTSGIKIDTNAADGIYNPDTLNTKYLNYTYSNGSGCNATTETVSLALGSIQDYAEYLVNANVYYLALNGLKQYVPDGSYIESNGYWAYGTNNIFEMCAALTSTTGTHYGILDAWGMDNTCYFALNTMSSDGLSYNYHDSNSVSPQDIQWFTYLGHEEALGDKTLSGISKTLYKNIETSASYYDAIYYLTDEEIGEWEYPELQYYMEGIDGYVFRDSWDMNEGTLFAGFMGEANNVTHGQVDGGAFVYYNKGTRWFCDLGTENYNASNFWQTNYRQKYYAMSAEGNNTLIVLNKDNYSTTESLYFAGQRLTGTATMTKTGNNEYGAFAVLDTTNLYTRKTSSYGSETKLASSALRGMLLTNDRKTFVIQDQVTFSSAQSVAWIAHMLPAVDVMLSVDGTVAYLSDGKTVMKVTLIDPDNAGLTFRVANCTDDEFLLDKTFSYDYSVSVGDETANSDYSAYKKLLIEASNVTKFNVAVVVEEVIPGVTANDSEGVGYSWTDMNSWNPTPDNRNGNDEEGTEAGAVATVTVTKRALPDVGGDDEGEGNKPDTPVVDIYRNAGRLSRRSDVTLTAQENDEVTVYTANSFEELAQYINENNGCDIVVDLYKSNSSPITINSACTVNTNGNRLVATSDTLIAEINGKTVEYKEGTVTVTWILSNGTKKTETYSSSVAATYKGSISTSSDIYEVDNGDGTYSYYTTGNAWATAKGGSQAKSNDMIVTSENNVFYQTGIKFDGVFVTVKGSTITGYHKADDFFTWAIFNNKYDRISLTSDFAYDGTGKNDTRTFGAPANIYLNGYTLTFTSADTSDHMFIANGGDLYVYGPGAINSQAESSNMFYNDVSSGDNIYVENADLYSVRAIIDLRRSKATFKNCTITIEKNAQAFGVINRNNATPIANQPYLYIDGCVINLPATTSGGAVITVRMNAKAEITGGTTIIAPNDPYLFRLENQQVSGTANFDYSTSYQEMYAITGEVYHSLTKLYTYVTDSTATGTYDLSGRFFYGEGYKYTTAPESFNVMSGLVSAKIDENTYVLAKAANCATVTWKSNTGTTVATEYWMNGTKPSASSDIKSKITVDGGKMLSFDTAEVSAGQSVSYTAVVVDAFGLKVNMSLQTDFHLNFFIENIGDMTIKLDGETVTPGTTSMPGYYNVQKRNISPTDAGRTVKLEVTYNGITVTKSISIIDYCERVLSDDQQSKEAKAMIVNIVKYIDAAYVYVGRNIGQFAAEYSKVSTLYSKYRRLATVSVVDHKAIDTSAISDAFSGAQLNLYDSPKYRFNLKEDYTGDVTINGKVYSVVNGTYDGASYIEITVKAFNLLDPVTLVTANGVAVEYSLANYYHYHATEHGAFANLLNALYAYCETAKIYTDSVN